MPLQASKNGNVDLVEQLDRVVEKARLRSEVESPELVERNGKIEELDLKVQLLADDLKKVEQLQAQVTAKFVKLTTVRVTLPLSIEALDTMTAAHA